jgi:methylmalonyl-CoA/ethylmalonyl-CoA epimerase
MKFHHLGMAVHDIDKGRAYLESLGGVVKSPVHEDAIQRVRVQFVDLGGQVIELVAPHGENSPVDGTLDGGKRIYHLCFEVRDLKATIEDWRGKGAILVVEPVPAVAFGDRRIAFMVTRERDLFEFVEAS